MKDQRLYSWIFLSIALASQNQPAYISEVSQIADGINCSVPTQKELQVSISWLVNENYVRKESKKYCLTSEGLKFYTEHSGSSKQLLKMWEFLERNL